MSADSEGPRGWTEAEWRALLLAIKHKRCTPFLGAGACAGTLPLGGDIAEAWAKEFEYPFSDTDNLVRVAQFVSVQLPGEGVKLLLKDKLTEGRKTPDFDAPAEPHRLVADLRLPVYVTTNYDDFLVRALAHADPERKPQRLVCSWHKPGERGTQPAHEASPERPLVFHLHGHLDDPASMVLTEDDYLDFLVATSQDSALVPPRVEQAFAESALLFLGYGLGDMNFKLLLRKLSSVRRVDRGAQHVSVQIGPRVAVDGLDPEKRRSLEQQAAAQKAYLEKQLGHRQIKVFWGTCQEFSAELARRLGASP